MTLPEKRLKRPSAILALLRARCPRCRAGRIFHSLTGMNPRCPLCELIFQREEGYFLGAMYVSYLIASIILIPAFFIVRGLLPKWDDMAVIGLVMVCYLPLIPFVFRYSRVGWIWFERWASPGDTSATAYEKRLREDERSPENPA